MHTLFSVARKTIIQALLIAGSIVLAFLLFTLSTSGTYSFPEASALEDVSPKFPGGNFDTYPIVIKDLYWNNNSKELTWPRADVMNSQITAYKVLFYTGETNFYNRQINNYNWVQYKGNYKATGNPYPLAFDSTHTTYTFALALKLSNGTVARSRVITTNNWYSEQSPIVTDFTYRGNGEFTWTNPQKDIVAYKIAFYTGSMKSQSDFEYKLQVDGTLPGCWFGPAYPNNCSSSHTISYRKGERGYVKLRDVPSNTNFIMYYVGRTGKNSQVSNIVTTGIEHPLHVDYGKRFPEYPEEIYGLYYDNSSKSLQWTADGIGAITDYRVLLFTGESDFSYEYINNSNWMTWRGSANRVNGNPLHINPDINHSLALLVQSGNRIYRSNVIQTNPYIYIPLPPVPQPTEHQYKAVTDLGLLDNGDLTWTHPHNEIEKYQIRYYTNESLSEKEFLYKMNNGQVYGTCYVGDDYYGTNCSYIKEWTQGAGRRVQVTGDSLPYGTYAVFYLQNDGHLSPIGNVVRRLQPNQNSPFSDVHSGHWFFEYAKDLFHEGIITGDDYTNKFRAGDAVNRAEAGKALLLLRGDDIDKGYAMPSQQCDVQSHHWFFPYVNIMYAENIAKGYPSSRCSLGRVFNAGDSLRRGEAVKMIIEAIGAEKFGGVSNTYTAGFRDVDSDLWFAPYVDTAYRHGLIDGYPDGTFRPFDTLNRAEFAKMLSIIQDRYYN